MSLWQGKRQEARGKSEEGLGDFTFLYTVWFYCVHLLTTNTSSTEQKKTECEEFAERVTKNSGGSKYSLIESCEKEEERSQWENDYEGSLQKLKEKNR